MPKSVLTRKRSMIARFAVLAMVFSLMAVALPASAHSVALDSTGPCPAATPSAGFTDIGGFDATTQTAINCLFAFGITTGTSATTYSPNDTITRWQMALFLIRQAADHGITIPAAVSQGYTDIGGLDAATQAAINQITQLGISQGTSSTTFSPNAGVTRWQMALFIYRTGNAAGVAFSSNAAHNEFTDILTHSAEAQTAINALADTRADPAGHIALGTGASAFSPDLVLVRWQMALFLTRLLAADNVVAPSGVRVVVTPTDNVSLVAGNARAYTATFKNADNTPYTGFVGIQVLDATSANAPIHNDLAEQVFIESATDGVAPVGAGAFQASGFAGPDGVVSFVIRHGGLAERVVVLAWEDLNNNLLTGSVGNNAPAEPFGLGGAVNFGAAAAGECPVTAASANPVTAVDKPGDRFEVTGLALSPCSMFYDANDVFLVLGAASTLDAFEAALNTGGDIVTSTYDPDTADQSTFNISTNVVAPLTVTSPSAATSVDAFSFNVTGTAVAGYTVAVYRDADNDGIKDAGEVLAGPEVVAAADGTWTVTAVLLQNSVNNFAATQRSAPAVNDDNTGVDVPAITETAAVAPIITNIAEANGGALGVLDAGDSLVIDFNEPMLAPNAGDSLTFVDLAGDQLTFTCGSGGTTCTQNDVDTITVVIGAPTANNNNDNGFIDDDAASQVQSASGWTGTDNNAVDVVASGAARLIDGF